MRPRQSDARTLVAFSLAVALPSSSQTILIPAIPMFAQEHGWSDAASTWLVSSFLVMASISAPMLGRAGDLIGRRWLIIVTSLLYLSGSALCLVGSDSLAILIVGRMLQGCAAGVFVLQIATVHELFTHARRGMSVGLLAGMVGIGPAVGFLVGGLLSERFGVVSVFVVGIALSVLAALLLWMWTPHSGGQTTGQIDVAGALLLGAWFGLLLFWLSMAGEHGWVSLRTAVLAGSVVLLFAVWATVQTRKAHPLIDLTMLRIPEVGWGTAATVVSGGAVFSLFLAVPQLVQEDSDVGFGLGPIGTGLVLAPGALMMVIVGPVSGWLGARVGHKVPAIIGSMISGAGLGALALFHDSLTAIIVWVFVASIGFGMTFPALPSLVMNAVEPGRVGAAAGINSLARGFGSAVGAQAAPVLIALGSPGMRNYGYTFLAAAVLAVGTAVLLWAVPPRS